MPTVLPAELGFDPERLARLTAAIDADVAQERIDGAVVLVARRGVVALHEAIGYADRAAGRRAKLDDVFCLFSITKTLTAVAVLSRVERGPLTLRPPVPDVNPAFGHPCG